MKRQHNASRSDDHPEPRRRRRRELSLEELQSVTGGDTYLQAVRGSNNSGGG